MLTANSLAEEHVLARLDTVDEAQSRVRADRVHRDHESLLASLGELDQTIGQAKNRITALESQVADDTAQLAKHRREIEAKRTLSEEEQTTLHNQLRATWRLHQLTARRATRFNQEPAKWRRTQRYIAALSQQLERRRGTARVALVDVMATVHDADAVNRTLVSQRRELQREQNNLKHLLASRQPLLIQLDAANARTGAKLITLYAEDDTVKEQLAVIDTALSDDEFPWPLVGKVQANFGDKKPVKGERWQGIQITAASGETVHAVGAGVVVFAGWLRGQGLLTIVDHGDGMMAVYGNNRSLLADVGDSVDAGTPLAVVGADSPQSDSNLYFELRLEGVAVDPLQWLSARPS